MLRAVHYFVLQLGLGLAATLEQPQKSQAFFLPAMKALLSSPGVGRIVLDYCRFGMRWKKPTAMVYTSKVFPALQKLALRCV